MYQNFKRTCRAIVFAHETHCFAALSLPSPSSLLKLPNEHEARKTKQKQKKNQVKEEMEGQRGVTPWT